MIDFNRTSVQHAMVCDQINKLIDGAYEAENAAKEKRDYLGASAIGEECLRKIQYQFRDPSPHFDGRILRIFERGHVGEEQAINWLKKAGFELKTHDEHGRQIGFVSGNGKYKGHIDGTILHSPIASIKTPCLWECKVLGAKGWNNVQSNGLQQAYPTYYAQIGQYQAYKNLTDPAMFFAVNADTMKIYVEMVKFDAKNAQKTTDKAVRILEAEQSGEQLPRAYPSSDFFKCKWCSYSKECWA